jgi:lysyl-tRNA synthetase, class II
MSDQQEPFQDTNKIIEERRTKLKEIRTQGNAFPNDFDRKDYAQLLHDEHGAKTNEAFDANPVNVCVAGRMMLKRVMGKASFATIQDMSGRIQLYIANDITGEAVHDAFKHTGTWVTFWAPKAHCSKPKPASCRSK